MTYLLIDDFWQVFVETELPWNKNAQIQNSWAIQWSEQ